MKSWPLFALLALVITWLECDIITSCSVALEHFKTFSCNDRAMKIVLRAQTVKEDIKHSLPLCAASCSFHIGCKYGVYRPSTKTCKLVSHAENLKSAVAGSSGNEEYGCAVVQKVISDNTPIKCQNGGSPRAFTCYCHPSFTGRHCEIANPVSCQDGDWRLITTHDHSMLSTSPIPVKMIFDSLILPVKAFDFHQSFLSFIAQAHDFFALNKNASSLAMPLETTFILHDVLVELTRTVKLNMDNGNLYDEEYKNPAQFYIPTVLDDNRLVYNRTSGSVGELISTLSDGHRFLDRGLTRVWFNSSQQDAVFENVHTRMQTDNGDRLNWDRPLSYHTFKESLKNNSRYVLNRLVGVPQTKNAYFESSTNHHWEMDRCWTEVKPTLDYDEFTAVLGEYVLNGHEIRVILNGTISSDVSTIVVNENETMAELAEFLTPFGPNRMFDVRIRHSVVSRTERHAECETVFQGSTVTNMVVPGRFPVTVAWYVSTKPWTKIYSLSVGDRKVLYGNIDELNTAALQGRNIRVCLVRSEGRAVCHGSTFLKVTNENDLLLQTPTSFRVHTNTDNTFRKLFDNDCSRIVRLVSSSGWVRKALFKTGVGSPHPVIRYEIFLRQDWFVEGT